MYITDLNHDFSLLGSEQNSLCHSATWIGTKLSDSTLNAICSVMAAMCFSICKYENLDTLIITSERTIHIMV